MTDDLPFTVTGEGGTLFTTDYTDFHRFFIHTLLNATTRREKTTPCESAYSVVSLYLLCTKRSALPAGTLPPACARLR